MNDQTARPIFVIGSLRSGVGILTWSIGQHPNVLPLVDSRWLGVFAHGLHQSYAQAVERRATSQLDIMGVEIEDFCAYFGRCVDNLLLNQRGVPAGASGRPRANGGVGANEPPPTAARSRPTRWVDGSPDHCFNVFGLLRLFPHAKFIHVIRDVDAVVAALTDPAREAIYRSHARRLTEQAAYEHWLESVRAGVEAEQAFGSDTVLRVRRDDLVADPEGMIRRCLSFIGEPFSPACLRPFR